MTDLKSQKRMAAEILGVGKNRVWIDPNRAEDVSVAIMKDDIRELIEEGVIQKKDVKGQSRGRARKIDEKKKKGRRKGHGKRRGKKHSKVSKKEKWMTKIRAQRKKLKELRDEGEITRSRYRELYKKSKGGEIRDLKHLMSLVEEEGAKDE
ncbi:50S ribosomal protein L19e [Methanonatronarchaeum sp. AMET6-2]|uniref:50S ribosomal protein L19e n=1 Tax=Methanonatronarchaeum sp. AMET6-2 TaxID=2933293 RepID=UPI0011FCB852|nr:50S ribosomal protein L19e [Methanonatronarchaeum sp. AMET6-2]RZN60225.1 MAG: 50S ribosomal protein L19e [Methanonatronarchaeia archaeon]UOY10719.1 50S ribosomal protein L19e [Methanonatronarchaeum sp. AMET6-2]